MKVDETYYAHYCDQVYMLAAMMCGGILTLEEYQKAKQETDMVIEKIERKLVSKT